MPTDLPDPPKSFGDMLSPEPKRKSVAAAVISGVTLLAIGGLLVSLVLVGGTPPEKVTAEDVLRLADRFFTNGSLAVTVLGNVNGLQVTKEQLAL